MKTLMATDGSNEATAALRTATRLLRRRDNEVEILCVAPEFYERGGRKEDKRVRAEYERRIAHETKNILDRAQQTRFGRTHERNSFTLGTCPSGSTDSMHVVLGNMRQVVVDYVR